eukprot:TRINITY_DN3922_c1_g1_i2.p2 TRINITY_DN3922_c1_g1~~TRINITY_DN3922_c1_g1_i2.p2  ORF type:complete len:185 (+),score=-22.39 TRINITY_DN3922_c1_g1_i2:745-1299(+)
MYVVFTILQIVFVCRIYNNFCRHFLCKKYDILIQEVQFKVLQHVLSQSAFFLIFFGNILRFDSNLQLFMKSVCVNNSVVELVCFIGLVDYLQTLVFIYICIYCMSKCIIFNKCKQCKFLNNNINHLQHIQIFKLIIQFVGWIIYRGTQQLCIIHSIFNECQQRKFLNIYLYMLYLMYTTYKQSG